MNKDKKTKKPAKRGTRHDPPTNAYSAENKPPGRRKGVKNKFTTLKKAFFDVFEASGGTKELLRWVKEDPDNQKCFYQMVAKMLPREIALTGSKEGEVQKIKVEIVGSNS